MKKVILFWVLVFALTVAFISTVSAQTSDFKPIGSSIYEQNGFVPHEVFEMPSTEAEIEGFMLMGIGCKHEVKGVSVFVDKTDPHEFLGDATVIGTECVPISDAPLLPVVMDSYPSQLLKTNDVIPGTDLSLIDNELANCHFEGYYYTAFKPIYNSKDELVLIEEHVVGVLLTKKSCSEVVPI